MRSIVYVRISKDRTGQEAGVQRQEAECRHLVEARGWDLLGVEQDNDISAFDARHRPAFERVKAMVAAKSIDLIVAWHPDRLIRNPRELEDFIDLLDGSGVQVETCRAGRYDLSTRSGRTTARIIGAVARDESEAKQERLRSMTADRARRGLPPGGVRHYGYERDEHGNYVIVPDEAANVRDAAQRVLAGQSISSIVTEWNRRGVPTVKGRGPWTVQTLKRILTSDTIAGERLHLGETHPGDWEAILGQPERDRLKRVLGARTRKPPPRVSMLAGLFRCGLCGAVLVSGRREGGRRVYQCPPSTRGGCGGIQISAEPVENAVGAAVVTLVDGPGFASLMDAGQDEEVIQRLTVIEAELDEWASDTSLPPRVLRKRVEALTAEQDALKAQVAQADGASTLRAHVGHLAARWEGLGLEERRAVVAAVFERIDVGRAEKRGPGFDARRLSPVVVPELRAAEGGSSTARPD